ncbi:uncharacterized protein BO66DRAFT_387792 [Aspergillus aculeatinus CBS 121060]|uniref:Uncharacterized protein n=1 Tax=Aspergillus aculeatinus CBS 121060 TaxID=1448322 RepID=A0ACD1HMZ8_9EURO|nr:hypothetical protein BO66DRAFT_387792 [Aspergillus aculeatinus CBS 121060]RAH74984.1 hypothetical protein BO66DRAFT_387792 [Aspergillus aculeatinus CBS 121060]
MRLPRPWTVLRKPTLIPRLHGPLIQRHLFHPWFTIPQEDIDCVTIPKGPPLTDVPLNFPPDLLRRNQENYLTYISRLLQRYDGRTWGFPIFRVFSTSPSSAEDKENLWSAYLLSLYRGVYKSFRGFENVRTKQAQLSPVQTNALFPRFYCPVIQPDVPILDKNGDGGPGIGPATRDAIRTRFADWVSNTTEERDGPGAVAMRDADTPQYRMCLIVDDYCLEQFKAAQTDGEHYGAPIIVLERDWTLDKYRGFYRGEWTDGETHKQPPDEPSEEEWEPEDESLLTFFEEVEGSRAPLLGWMYARSKRLGSLYARIEMESYHSAFYHAYARPPGIYPDDSDAYWKYEW